MLTRTRISYFPYRRMIVVPIGKIAFTVIQILISIREVQSNINILIEYLNTITELDISQTKLIDKDIENISLALEHNTTLKIIDLGENQISNSIKYIAKALTINHTLKCLVLWDNAIDAVGASYLADALQINYGLTRLNLGRNPITDAGLNALANGIASMTHRRVERSLLNLSENGSQKTQEEINQLLQKAFYCHADQMNKKLNSRPISRISHFLLWSYSQYRLGATTLTALGVGIYITHHYMKRTR